MQQDLFKFFLNGEVFTIPPFKKLVDLSKNIQSKLIFTPQHQYEVESKVRSEIFKDFINYLIKDNIPNIQISNINEYEELSIEFEQLQSEVEQKKSEYGQFLVNLNGLQRIGCSQKSQYEEEIATKLDEYISKYGLELMKSPIQSLHIIFNHKKRNLTLHNDAYELIKKHFEKTNDSNIFILLDSLDGTKLTRSNIEESFSMFSERNDHMPKVDFSYLSEVFANQRKQEERLALLENKFEKQTQEFQNLIEKQKLIEQENLMLKQKYNDDIENLKKQIENLTKNIENNYQSHQNDIESVENKNREDHEKFEIRIQKLEKENKRYKEQTENLNQINKQLEVEIEKVEKENNQNKLKNDQFTDLIKNLEKENKQFKEQTENLDQINKQLETKIKNIEEESNKNKQEKDIANGLKIFYKKDFDGIINYLNGISNGYIENKIMITASTIYSGNEKDPTRQPRTVTFFNDHSQAFLTKDKPNGWILFDFKDNQVNPTGYTFRTIKWWSIDNNNNNPKCWVIEGSNDKNEWDILDEQQNCAYTNGPNLIHTFQIKNKIIKAYRFIKIRQTNLNWSDNNLFGLDSFEIYGTLI